MKLFFLHICVHSASCQPCIFERWCGTEQHEMAFQIRWSLLQSSTSGKMCIQNVYCFVCHYKATHHFQMMNLEEILVFFLYLGKWHDYQIHSDVCCVANCAILMMWLFQVHIVITVVLQEYSCYLDQVSLWSGMDYLLDIISWNAVIMTLAHGLL